LQVELKRPWWQATSSLRVALFMGGGYLLVGVGGITSGSFGGRIWIAVMDGLFCLLGVPWYITAIVLLRRRHRAGTEKARL
jgi:hypothetical protein